ncbi:unnamed protein product [Arabis nemorensis]|uniref:Peptidyl-prolyl cis-trans isomerase n=1 Tax=Arabis nemorensis TaxID=586526 RepID=A0A565BDJ2_9BRAS|nr:unnamed protein product [Arabis nemorensis]
MKMNFLHDGGLTLAVPSGQEWRWGCKGSSSGNGNPKVFFDIAVGDRPVGRIVMELFADTTPKMAENFRAVAEPAIIFMGNYKFCGGQLTTLPTTYLRHCFRALCTGDKGMGKLGRPLHYKGSIIHHISPGYIFHGGDITYGNGEGGESIYDDVFFEKENFIRQCTGPGFLTMSNKSVDKSNGSQFEICMKKDEHLGYENVVFGQLIQGLDVITTIMGMEEAKTRPRKPPNVPVVITDCGQIS